MTFLRVVGFMMNLTICILEISVHILARLLTVRRMAGGTLSTANGDGSPLTVIFQGNFSIYVFTHIACGCVFLLAKFQIECDFRNFNTNYSI